MLLWLTAYLTQFYSGFRVFQYLSFRSIISLLTAFIIALLISPPLINELMKRQIGQSIRELGPQSHQKKRVRPRWVAHWFCWP